MDPVTRRTVKVVFNHKYRTTFFTAKQTHSHRALTTNTLEEKSYNFVVNNFIVAFER